MLFFVSRYTIWVKFLICFYFVGFGGVYRGLFPTILKQGSNQGIRFFTFHEVRKFMQGEDKKEALGVVQSLIAGGIAGAASVIGNNPIDVVKSRMQGLGASKYKNSWDCAKQVIRTDGFMGKFKDEIEIIFQEKFGFLNPKTIREKLKNETRRHFNYS